MRRPRLTFSNPLKTSNRPDPRFVLLPPLPRGETPLLCSPPSYFQYPQKACRRRPASRSLCLLFALNNCSSTPSLSPQSALLSRSSLPFAYFQKVPHFWHWFLVARSAPRFYLINLTNSPQAVIVPLSRNILGSILPTWCKEKGDIISIATRDCVLFKMTTAVASATAAPIPQLDRGISPRTYPTLAPSTSAPSIDHSQMSSTSGLQGGVSPSEQNAQKTPTDGRRSPKS